MSEMVNMAPPWQGMTREEISSAVAASERPFIAPELAASAPTGWIELMQQCWDQDPTNRPNFDAIHDVDALEQICRDVEHAGEFDNASATRQTSRLRAPDNMSNHELEMGMYILLCPVRLRWGCLVSEAIFFIVSQSKALDGNLAKPLQGLKHTHAFQPQVASSSCHRALPKPQIHHFIRSRVLKHKLSSIT